MIELPTLYQQFIFLRSYSRWDWDKGRREHWDETVDRYFSFLRGRVPKKLLALYADVQEQVLHLNVMPSMRALWSAGPALERENLAAYNCFSGDTEFLTKKGYKKFSDVVDTSVEVLCGDRQWRTAKVSKFGEDRLYTLKLAHGAYSKRFVEINTTVNHRWYIYGDLNGDGPSVLKETKDLQKGEVIQQVFPIRSDILSYGEYKNGVMHGAIYGDGTKFTRHSAHGIRLCGEKAELLKYFDGRISYPKSTNGDPYVYLKKGYDNGRDFKELPSMNESDDYLLGFIRGWFATDGSVQKNGQINIAFSYDDYVWFADVSSKFGWLCGKWNQFNKPTNYGGRTKQCGRCSIQYESLIKEDCLLPTHRDNFKENADDFWRVLSVEPTDRVEPVYCVTEPETSSFILTNAILTGNCAYAIVDSPDVFSELLYVWMNGTGVSFSVERQWLINLPDVPYNLEEVDRYVVVEDSKEGWAQGVRDFINHLYEGYVFKYDLSKIRPEGAILRTFGGRASGPRPLKRVFDFALKTFQGAKGRKLNSLECHDLLCLIAECIEMGGVRRAAGMSLSNLSDQRMQHAKDGAFWELHPYRKMANNSVAYTEKPDMKFFMEEWLSLAVSGTGERGIFNRESCKKIFEMNGNRRIATPSMGQNPCGEIILRDEQLCNLTEVVVRPNDNLSSLIKKVKGATLLGMIQATLTDFHFVSSNWAHNCNEENLLGVSLTGTCDHPVLSQISDRAADWLSTLKNAVVDYSAKWATLFGINAPTATTADKPSGTVSQLVNCSPGIHRRNPVYSEYYIRRVRVTQTDPLAKYLADKGFPWTPEIGQKKDSCTTMVFDFPFKSPESAFLVKDRGAIGQLEYWMQFQKHYCEHKPSYTCYVKPDEWLEVGAWVFKNWDMVSGISFLPDDGGIYELAPYEAITKSEYESLLASQPKITFDGLTEYEKEDYTEGSREFACSGGACTI
jgi:ribonucleoside-diphosphate reductase alpha chain